MHERSSSKCSLLSAAARSAAAAAAAAAPAAASPYTAPPPGATLPSAPVGGAMSGIAPPMTAFGADAEANYRLSVAHYLAALRIVPQHLP